MTLRRAFKLAAVVARLLGERYRGLKGWNVEDVARVGPPAKNGEVDGGGNDLNEKKRQLCEDWKDSVFCYIGSPQQ